MQLSAEQVVVFILSISIMLFLAKLLGEIFIKFNQPAIIGEIFAGILLGPTVLGMLSPDLFNWLFPANNEVKIALDGFTTIAVVLLLLVSGLEVDLSIVLKNRKTAFSISVVGILIPFLLGFGISYLFPGLMGIRDENLKMAFSLFMGTAIAISSLPIIAKILMDLKIFKTQIGFIIIAAAMLNDLMGWLIFSVILGMIESSGHGMGFIETLLLISAFVGFTLIIGRRWINKAIPFIQNKLSFPGAILNFILILGFLGAAFTEYIGIHAILGAFIVGIAIGDSGHLKERTREIIQQFITNIFAPLFFVSIGLRVNFITSFDPLIVITLLLLALVGKVLGCALGAKLGGLGKNDSFAVGWGMSSSGAMGIIIGLLALQYGLIHEEVFVAIIIMALATSIASAPMMNYFLNKKENLTFKGLLKPENFIYTFSKNKNEVIKELSAVAAFNTNLNEDDIFSSVIEKEIINSSGIANYLAIPHSKLKVKTPFIACAFSKEGINFNSSDGKNAKFIFLLLTPEDKSELQLQLLAEIVKIFEDEKRIEFIAQLENKEDIISAFKFEKG